MYLREITFGVQNCLFHETIISDNTERGSLKLTRCSCWKKVHETDNLSAKECWNTKQNLCLSWSFLLPNLRSGVLCLFSSVHGGLDPIAIQSNRLLGNPSYTLTKRLLANLTDLRFVFGFCLACKNGFECITFHLNTCQIQRLCCLALILASSWPCLSHTKMRYNDHGALCMKDYYRISQKFLEQRMLWVVNFKKI